MPPDSPCRECGAPVPTTAPGGCCPRCLLALAANTTFHESATTPMSDHPHPFPTESGNFGGYQLLDRVGEGGMGVVYRARQPSLNRTVALKLMRAGAFATAEETRRFRGEAQAAARLRHPNVVAIHEVGEHDGISFFSMEYVEGQSLSELVRVTPLSSDRAARYVRTIAEAMHHAHQHGVLHRDLKPANVLIDLDDQPRVTDFGLAKRIEAQSVLTQPGAVLGTPSYMPPEQAAGRHESLTPASDVYSLGAILYDLLTGRPPFRAETALDTLRQVLDAEPAAPRLLNPKVPRDLETICLKCLSKEPSRRYPSAESLAQDLQRFLNREPIQARPPGRIERLWRWAHRKPGIAGLAAGSSLLLVLLAVAASLQVTDAQRGNTVAALLASRTIRLELDRMGADLTSLAQDPGFLSELERDRPSELARYLQKHSRNEIVPGLQLANWMILGTNGAVRARWPSDQPPEGVDFTDRDYFQGALENAAASPPRPYISQAFRSLIETDPQKRERFGVTLALRDPRGTLRAVLCAMVQLDTVERALGLRAEHQRKLMVVGQYEGTNFARSTTGRIERPRFALLMHPEMVVRDPVVLIEEPLLEAMLTSPAGAPATRLFFRDPLQRHQTFDAAGWHQASLVRVPDTRFIVVCQSRNHVANAALTAGLAGLGIGLALLVRRFRRRDLPSPQGP